MTAVPRWLVVGATIVVLAGCARAGEGAGPASSDPSTAATTMTSSPTPTGRPSPTPAPSPGPTVTPSPTPTPAPSPTETGDDLVLAGQFSAFVGGFGGPGECAFGVEEVPDVHLLEADRLALGGTAIVCFVGFDLAAPVELAITWPGGSRTVEVVFDEAVDPIDLRDTPGPLHGWVDALDDTGRLYTLVGPGTPQGDWRLAATQHGATATLDVVAGPGTTPSMLRVDGPDADVLSFRISGFPPGATSVGLYRVPPTAEPGTEGASDRVTVTLERELATIVADEVGAATLDLDVGDLPEGRWCITPAVWTEDGFCAARLGGW